jgi:protein-disulfide isomerase
MDAWLFQHAPGKATLDYTDAIRSIELDAGKFNACLPSERTFERVDAEYVDTTSAKISGTPTYILDGKHYDGGLVLEELKKRL